MDEQVTTKRRIGRPLKFQSVKDFDRKVDEYFEQAEFPTITGMAVFLDTSRETLREYQERPDFVDSIKKALDRCQAEVETRAMQGKANPVMSIFTLKNNYGWVDKYENDGRNQNTNLNANVDATDLTDEQIRAKLDSLRASQGS